MFLNKFRLVTAMHRNGPLPQVNILRLILKVYITELIMPKNVMFG